MYKSIKIFLLLYITYCVTYVYSAFYKPWYTFEINTSSLVAGRNLHANGLWTGFDLIQPDVVNSSAGLTYGLSSFFGMPLIVIIFSIATALLYLGYVTNSFMLCLAPFICSVYAKAQINTLNFKMMNPLFGGNFNSATGIVSQILTTITTMGYVGAVIAVLAFIKYRKENKNESNAFLNKVLRFSRESE